MKTLKTILAWLDWSSYCGDDYTRPNNLCSLFWRTFFTLITLPLTYVTHLINVFTHKNGFRESEYCGFKVHLGHGALIHTAFALLGGVVSKDLIEKNWQWNWFDMSDSILFNYVKVMGVAIVTGILALIITALILLIGRGFYLALIYLGDKFGESKPESKPEKKPNMIVKIYKAIKDKYCPLIDWSDIEIT